uniref:Ig-like domain-containing protein n=1 Tax=Panagrolaimus sp. ES5 TaxID=591445 RepID=A0AC34FCW9_9BILA
MSGAGTDQPISQTLSTNSDGCVTLTISCSAPTPGGQIVLFWTEQGADRGTSTGMGSVSRPLVCNANGDLILTEPVTGGMGVVDQVECVSAT